MGVEEYKKPEYNKGFKGNIAFSTIKNLIDGCLITYIKETLLYDKQSGRIITNKYKHSVTDHFS